MSHNKHNICQYLVMCLKAWELVGFVRSAAVGECKRESDSALRSSRERYTRPLHWSWSRCYSRFALKSCNCVHTGRGESVKRRPGRPASNAVERLVDARLLWRRSIACHVFKGAAKQTRTLILCRQITSRVLVNLMKYLKCERKKLIDGNLTI